MTHLVADTLGAAPPPPSADAAVEAPDDARYALGEEIARGGIGRIVRAYDRKLDRPVALKALLGGEDAARFAVEALLTAHLEHPNIIPVHDVGRLPDGQSFYAMKLVSGRSLAEALGDRATLGERLALLPHLIDVAEALAYAHSRRVVHRDLKPHNVLIGPFGETVVIDWGLAKLLADPSGAPRPSNDDAAGGGVEAASAALTLAGTVLGTPEYMAPEQALGQPVDPRVDVYAIGAMLYELMAGAPPLRRTPGRVREQVLAGPSARLLEVAPEAPRELVAIAEKAMAREPGARYASAAELADELRRFRDGQRVSAYAYRTREILGRWVKRWRLAIAAAAVALVSLVAALIVVAIDRAVLSEALAGAEQRERDAVTREREAVTREHAAKAREAAAVARADRLRLGQARLEAGRDPPRALALLAGLSPVFEAHGAARVIAADALTHVAPRVLAQLDGARYELAIAPDGAALAWARADGELRVIGRDGAIRTVGALPSGGTAVTWAPDAKTFAAGDSSGALVVVDAARGEARRFGGHGAGVQTIAWAPDGRRFATSALEPGARVWDVATGTSRTLPSEDPILFGLAWSADGTRVATTGDTGTIVVHDVVGEAAPQRFRVDGYRPASVRFAPDGGALLTGDPMGRVELIELATGRAKTLAADRSDARYSADGTLVAVAHDEGVVDVVAAADGAAVRRLACGDRLWSVAFTGDGRHLVVAARDALCVYDVGSWERRVLVGHQDGILYTFTAAAGGAVAAIDGRGRLVLHDLTAAPTTRAVSIGTPVRALAFTPDASTLLATSNDTVFGIDVFGIEGSRSTERPSIGIDFAADTATRLAHVPGARRMALAPDGARVAVTGSAPVVTLVGLGAAANRGEPSALPLSAPATDVAFAPDGRRLAASGSDGAVSLWDLAEDTATVVARHADVARGVGFSRDGRWLASVGLDATMYLYDFHTGAARAFETSGRLGFDVGFGAGDRLVAVSGDSGACVWDVASGERRVCDTNAGRVRPTFVEGGRYLVVAGATGALFLPTEPGLPPRTLGGHRDLLTAAVSPDDARLATADFDGVVRLWDLGSGEGRLLATHGGMVPALAFSPDGELVASAGLDGVVRLHRDDLPLEPAALRAAIAALAPATTDAHPDEAR